MPLEVQVLRARLRALEQRGLPGAEVLRAQLRSAEPDPDARHLLFVPTAAGYRLVDRRGAPPPLGSELRVDARTFVVLKLGRSPLPGDRRRCAFLAWEGLAERCASPGA